MSGILGLQPVEHTYRLLNSLFYLPCNLSTASFALTISSNSVSLRGLKAASLHSLSYYDHRLPLK
ncbi:hypothetical protein LXA43DRAFT_1097201 [Ganoderma leucocontextum]|nr:hypothetical protein LXA43DRAFT_1097201 [Ganoderma leucocontextum]